MHRFLLRGALALAFAASCLPASADRVSYDPPTTWGHPTSQDDSSIRGLAFDGDYYYVADCNDYLIDGRPRDDTGRIYIYDLTGRFVKRIPEVPPVKGAFFGHGVATDGARLWTSGYFDPHIYEYDISTGALLRVIPTRASMIIRLDYIADRHVLVATRYGDPRIYVVALDGRMSTALDTHEASPNLNVAPDGRGDLWTARFSGGFGGTLSRTDRQGAVLQSYGFTAWTSIATNIRHRDGGYVQDLAPVYDAAHQRWQAPLQQVHVSSVGGSDSGLQGATATCTNTRTGQSVTAHAANALEWNCEDAGLAVSAGDAVSIQVTGSVR